MHVLKKYPGEDLVRRVADLKRDLRDRKVRPFEECAGFLHSQPCKVKAGRHPQALLEHAREMEGRELRLGSQFVEADILRKPRMHQIQAAPFRPRCEAPLGRGERRAGRATEFSEDFAARSACQQT